LKKDFEKFSISYDAKSADLSHHQINAKDLGEAISAMSDLLEEATLLYTKGGADVELMVTTPAKKGSLIVDFLVQASSPATLEILKHIGFTVAGGALTVPTLINTIKKLNNRKIIRINIETSSKRATVVTENGDFECDPKIAEMIGNKKIRNSLHKIIQAPLHDKPDAEFKVLNSKHDPIVKIEESKLGDFAPMPTGSLEEVSVENLHISISFAQVNFDSKRGWKIVLPDGREKSALMQDTSFLSKAKANQQAFKKGDSYEARIRVTTTERPIRSTILYEVMEITRHWVGKENRLI
jgi:hypothetical protein